MSDKAPIGAFSDHPHKSDSYAVLDPIAGPALGEAFVFENVFFGAVGITATTTPSDLRLNQGSAVNSGVPDPSGDGAFVTDGSMYTVPTLYATPDRTGKPLLPNVAVNAYWRSRAFSSDDGVDPEAILPWPEDLAMIGGDMCAGAPGHPVNPPTVAFWSAISSKSTTGAPLTTIPDQVPVSYPDGGVGLLRATVMFPSCYDGGGDASLSWWNDPMAIDHFCYPVSTPAGSEYGYTAPEGFYSIPEVDLVFRWDLSKFDLTVVGTGADAYYDTSGLTLSTDNQSMAGGTSGPHGTTLHAGWMSGFAQTDINRLVLAANRAALGGPRNLGIVKGGGQV